MNWTSRENSREHNFAFSRSHSCPLSYTSSFLSFIFTSHTLPSVFLSFFHVHSQVPTHSSLGMLMCRAHWINQLFWVLKSVVKMYLKNPSALGFMDQLRLSSILGFLLFQLTRVLRTLYWDTQWCNTMDTGSFLIPMCVFAPSPFDCVVYPMCSGFLPLPPTSHELVG